MQKSQKPRFSIPSSIAFSLFSCLLAIVCVPSLGLTQSRERFITLGNKVMPDPLVIRGETGGKYKAAELINTEGTSTGFCNGFVNKKPNHFLVLSNFFEFLKIEINSNSDTSIIIEGPGGVWCNDDFHGINPLIEGQWQPGKYKIWIGSYQKNNDQDYQMKITSKNQW